MTALNPNYRNETAEPEFAVRASLWISDDQDPFLDVRQPIEIKVPSKHPWHLYSTAHRSGAEVENRQSPR